MSWSRRRATDQQLALLFSLLFCRCWERPRASHDSSIFFGRASRFSVFVWCWLGADFPCYLLFSVWSPPYTAATLAHSHAHKCLMPHAFFRGSRPPASHAASPTPLWCCGCGVCIVGCRGMGCRVRVRECRVSAGGCRVPGVCGVWSLFSGSFLLELPSSSLEGT